MIAGASPPGEELRAVAELIVQGRIEAAAELAPGVHDVAGLADLVADAPARTEFLDVDMSLVRLVEDVLDRLPADALVHRARLAAKLAFELRGDPASLERRRALLSRAAHDAAASGDDAALCAALLAQASAMWEPSGAADRLAATEAAIEAARRCRDLDRELAARLGRIDTLVELGRVGDAELELATYARLVRPLDRPDLDTFVASRRASFALVRGRLDDMLSSGEQAHRAALAAGLPDAARLGDVYRATSARERAGADADETLAEIATVFTRMAARMPGHYFEADAAAALALTGRAHEARAELARALPSLLSSYGHRWHFAACDAAEAAATAGTDAQCELLYDALLPHQDGFVVLGPMFWGSIPHRLGALALRLGRVEDAVAHLSRAVRDLDAIAALTWATRARIELARALDAAGDTAAAHRERTLARDTMRTLGMTRGLAELEAALADTGPPTWSLLRDGAHWLLDTGIERARLHGGRGFEQLRTLLANPAREVAAFALDAADGAPAPDSGLEKLDEQAMAAYRRRLREIDTELDAADQRGDARAATSLTRERGALLAELRSASGLGGRCRLPLRPGRRRTRAVAAVTIYPRLHMQPSSGTSCRRLVIGLVALAAAAGLAGCASHDPLLGHKTPPVVADVPAAATPPATIAASPVALSTHQFVRASAPTSFTLTGRLFTITAHVCPMANIRPYDPPGEQHHTVCWVKSGFGVAPSSTQPATTYLFGHSWAEDSLEVLNKLSAAATSELLQARPHDVDGVPVYPVHRLDGYRLVLRTATGTLTYRVRSAWGIRKDQLGFITSWLDPTVPNRVLLTTCAELGGRDYDYNIIVDAGLVASRRH